MVDQTKVESEPVDLKEQILLTTEVLLRRYGATKLSVVDVAREIGMSHGNVYRFFASKSVLMAAIAERWLARVKAPLEAITNSEMPADKKLEHWLAELRRIKRQKFLSDPQLFAIYGEIAEQAREEVRQHIETMVNQVEQIIVEGKKAGLFACENPRQAAVAVLNATARFHHPTFVVAADYPSEEEAQELTCFVIRSLKFDNKKS